jgi:HlyD family secretion protein
MDSEKKEIIFRKKALEQISRPVAIDDVLQVLTTKNWILLLVVFLLTLIFVAWLFKGQLFISVEGRGILMSSDGDIITVQAPAQTGTIDTIYVKPGEQVSKGSKLFIIKSDITIQLQSAKKYLATLKKEQLNLAVKAKEIISDLEKNQNDQVSKINQSKQAALEKLKQLQIMQTLKESALKKGIIDLPNVTLTRIEYYNLLQEIGSHEANLISMKANMIDLREKWRERERDFGLTVLKQTFEVEQLQQQLNESSLITSPITGTVGEVRAMPGDRTRPGDIIISIIPSQSQLYALLLVQAKRGKLIKPGMKTLLNPDIFNKLEYGSIKGEVVSITSLPVSSDFLVSLLKNKELVASFVSDGPLLALRIKLNKNNKTKTGYEWTSNNGPDFQLTQGTLISGNVNVESKHPIDLLVHFMD